MPHTKHTPYAGHRGKLDQGLLRETNGEKRRKETRNYTKDSKNISSSCRLLRGKPRDRAYYLVRNCNGEFGRQILTDAEYAANQVPGLNEASHARRSSSDVASTKQKARNYIQPVIFRRVRWS